MNGKEFKYFVYEEGDEQQPDDYVMKEDEKINKKKMKKKKKTEFEDQKDSSDVKDKFDEKTIMKDEKTNIMARFSIVRYPNLVDKTLQLPEMSGSSTE